MTLPADQTGPITSGLLQLEGVVQADGWPEGVDSEVYLGSIAAAIAARLDLDRPELAVIAFADDATVQALNARYRSKDQPTNVLSFPAGDTAGPGPEPGQPWPLGDIVLARETVSQEAISQGIDFSDHTTHLIIHGVLHLFGYDHIVDREAEEMEALEVEILAGLSVSNPYTEEAIGSD
jgi:probable rRNA maturation factor